MTKHRILTTCTALLLFSMCPFLVSGAGTFSQVYQLLQTNCSGAVGCHDGSDATFRLDLSEADLYNALVNGVPQNAAAAAKGHKLVTPGETVRSFLLRKIAFGISDPLVISHPDEGNYMPDSNVANKLADKEIELVRQWILFGAPLSGNVVDTAMINSYYRDGGKDDTYADHTPPTAGTGFQIYLGRIFMKPHTETYYYIKHDPKLAANIEIPKVATMLPHGTHHFVIYKFAPGGDVNYRVGLRDSVESSHSDVLDGIGTGPNLWQYDLPEGTAYFWNKNTMLDLNLHIRNNTDTITSSDLYINIYTQPVGTAENFMLIRNFPVFSISIPQDGHEHSFTEIANDTAETRYWKIWQMYTHTHKYGTDYDVYLRDVDGSMNRQIYEGFYSYEKGFNTGYYRTGVDATFLYFPDSELLQVDPRLGFFHESKYLNTDGPNPINWGFNSTDEMMVMGFQYVYGDSLPKQPLPLPTSIQNEPQSSTVFNVFPNPAQESFSVNFILNESSDVKMDLTNVLGESTIIFDEPKQAGNYMQDIDLGNSVAPGLYALTLRIGQKAVTKKIILQ